MIFSYNSYSSCKSLNKNIRWKFGTNNKLQYFSLDQFLLIKTHIFSAFEIKKNNIEICKKKFKLCQQYITQLDIHHIYEELAFLEKKYETNEIKKWMMIANITCLFSVMLVLQ